MNPLSDQGVPLGCLRCKSIFHFVKDCREENRGNNNGGYGGNRGNGNRYDRNKERNSSFRDHEVNFSYLFVGCASSEEDRLQQLIKDSLGYAILDSGCANSVAGVDWFRNYEKQLSVGDKLDIQIAPSIEYFTFGDGKKVKSLRKITFPCWMGGKRGNFTVDIVDCKIPLLMSRKSMSRAKMIVDFGKDSAIVQGRRIKLKITCSGHYALPLSL